jgi:hypothetical protein
MSLPPRPPLITTTAVNILLDKNKPERGEGISKFFVCRRDPDKQKGLL